MQRSRVLTTITVPVGEDGSLALPSLAREVLGLDAKAGSVVLHVEATGVRIERRSMTLEDIDHHLRDSVRGLTGADPVG